MAIKVVALTEVPGPPRTKQLSFLEIGKEVFSLGTK